MLGGSNLITAVVLIVLGLALTVGLFDWIIRFAGIALIAWGIVLAIVAVAGGRRGRR